MLQNTLRKSYNRNAKSTLVVLAVQMFLLCCSDVFGCYVRNVQLFAGPNSTDAHNKVYAGEVLYSPIGKTVYFCGRCEHGWNPPHDDLIYEWDFDDGVTDTDPYDWDDYDEHESHIYSDADEYHPKLTICVEDGMCGSDVCDI